MNDLNEIREATDKYPFKYNKTKNIFCTPTKPQVYKGRQYYPNYNFAIPFRGRVAPAATLKWNNRYRLDDYTMRCPGIRYGLRYNTKNNNYDKHKKHILDCEKIAQTIVMF